MVGVMKIDGHELRKQTTSFWRTKFLTEKKNESNNNSKQHEASQEAPQQEASRQISK
jgi:hypothetical protein